ncbi:IclR family transcriptional regulator [Fusicatenibacter saccharivorans]|uniref:IclR family transcriptional regulator n=1 Tax=Fusicatenibacter saccharivorans TaxID=1150298 RepID=UPI003CFC5F03
MEENVRVVDRVFDIIEVLAASDIPMSLSDIAKHTGMSKSTVHRLLSSMCTRHYVEKNSDNNYSIGYKLMETVSLHINNLELLTEAKPFLTNIMRDLNLTAHMGILDGCDVVYLEKLDIYPNTRLYTQVGFRSPAYCSSMGKCLLSCLSGDELEDALYDCEFKRYTPNTITDIREFKRYLRVVRRQGWAMDNEEYQLGHRCVGAPVFDYRGTPVAAISASGSITQLSDRNLEAVIKEVKQSAASISRKMGYVG